VSGHLCLLTDSDSRVVNVGEALECQGVTENAEIATKEKAGTCQSR
jgi:hypothetical protein